MNLHPDYLWSNIDIITNDGLQYIGKIKDNLFIATGFNTWGLTNSVLSSKILSDIIMNKDNEYIKLFDPSRINIHQLTGACFDISKNLGGIVNGLIKSSKKHICPHMGCSLIYNDIENTWDCPCHGSRFDKDGKVISAPSNKDIDI